MEHLPDLYWGKKRKNSALSAMSSKETAMSMFPISETMTPPLDGLYFDQLLEGPFLLHTLKYEVVSAGNMITLVLNVVGEK